MEVEEEAIIVADEETKEVVVVFEENRILSSRAIATTAVMLDIEQTRVLRKSVILQVDEEKPSRS